MSALLQWMKDSPAQMAAIGVGAAAFILVVGEVVTDIIKAWRRG